MFLSLLSLFIIISAILVIMSVNPVHSVFFLILVFLNSAFLLVSYEIEYLSLLLVLVYVGAIAILFLFVVMMLDVDLKSSKSDTSFSFPLGIFLGMIFFLEVLFNFLTHFNVDLYKGLEEFTYINWLTLSNQASDIVLLAKVLYTTYFIYFLLAGILLLVAMIGAIVLTINFQHKAKHQLIFKQLARSKENSIYLAK